MSGSLDLARLFESEGPKLRRFLERFGPSVPADDIAQDSFARLCASRPGEVVSPRAFLFRTARNLAIDSLRRKQAAPMIAVANLDDLPAACADPSAEDALVRLEETRLAKAAIGALPPLLRQALMLRRVENLSPDELALRLGVSVRHASRLVVKAMAACHAYVAQRRDNPALPR